MSRKILGTAVAIFLSASVEAGEARPAGEGLLGKEGWTFAGVGGAPAALWSVRWEPGDGGGRLTEVVYQPEADGDPPSAVRTVFLLDAEGACLRLDRAIALAGAVARVTAERGGAGWVVRRENPQSKIQNLKSPPPPDALPVLLAALKALEGGVSGDIRVLDVYAEDAPKSGCGRERDGAGWKAFVRTSAEGGGLEVSGAAPDGSTLIRLTGIGPAGEPLFRPDEARAVPLLRAAEDLLTPPPGDARRAASRTAGELRAALFGAPPDRWADILAEGLIGDADEARGEAAAFRRKAPTAVLMALVDVLSAKAQGRAVESLIEIAETSDQPRVQMKAAGAVSGKVAADPAAARPPILAFLRRFPNAAREADRPSAVPLLRAAALLKDADAGDLACDALPWARADERAAILDLLGLVAAPRERHRQTARSLLPASEPLVRRAALRAAGRLGDRRDLPALVERLERGDSSERAAAHEALRLLTGHPFPADPRRWRAVLGEVEAGAQNPPIASPP